MIGAPNPTIPVANPIRLAVDRELDAFGVTAVLLADRKQTTETRVRRSIRRIAQDGRAVGETVAVYNGQCFDSNQRCVCKQIFAVTRRRDSRTHYLSFDPGGCTINMPGVDLRSAQVTLSRRIIPLRGVDMEGWAARRGQSMEDIGPNAFRSPSNEPVIKRLAWPINIRRIDPTASGFEHVNDAADDPSVINARLASRIGRKKRLKPSKLTFR